MKRNPHHPTEHVISELFRLMQCSGVREVVGSPCLRKAIVEYCQNVDAQMLKPDEKHFEKQVMSDRRLYGVVFRIDE